LSDHGETLLLDEARITSISPAIFFLTNPAGAAPCSSYVHILVASSHTFDLGHLEHAGPISYTFVPMTLPLYAEKKKRDQPVYRNIK
jgi:hypothetical protein